MNEIIDNLSIIDDINEYDFIFIASDYSNKIPKVKSVQMMTSADRNSDAVMWLQQDYSMYKPLPQSEYTDVPTVGFVGRCPIYEYNRNVESVHPGFEERNKALNEISKSENICSDFHIRTHPTGTSAGFWDPSLPDFRKNGPLFKTNMIANQYQLCVRGNANWSLRFYETLAYGRIPLLIDTGGKWPIMGEMTTKELIKKYGLIFPVVYPGESIEEKLIGFHQLFFDFGWGQSMCRDFYDRLFGQYAQIYNFDKMFGDKKCV
jgi:hypothetical protein